MKCGTMVCLALGLVALAEVPAAAQFQGPRGSEPNPAKYGWLSSLEEGKAQAKKIGKPLMVVLRCVP